MTGIRRITLLIASGAAVLGLALWARYGLVEWEDMALLCARSADVGCMVRDAVIATFTHQRLGYFGLVASLLALIPRLRRLAWLGWFAGLAGLVLYCWDYAAPAALLALLLLARPANANSRHSASHA